MSTSASLNEQQQAAVRMAVAAAQQPGSVVTLSGPAGTGKTTTLRAIVRALGGGVLLLAPTGRAALRAKQATGEEASTIHSWLYTPVQDRDTGEVTFVERLRLGADALDPPRSGLIIIDEASMVNRDVWEHVHDAAAALGLSVLLVGDGFQLPPVASPGEEPFSVFDESFICDAAVTLTQVYRQADDSPILKAATALRSASWAEARRIVACDLPRLQADVDEVGARLRAGRADAIVIAHRNETRQRVNNLVRDRLGLGDASGPQFGEPLLVRRNSPDVGVFNGEIVDFGGWLSPERNVRGTRVRETRLNGVRCTLAPRCVLGAEGEPSRWVALDLKSKGAPLVRAQLGYAVTCHSAQGSEWERAIVIFEHSLEVMPEEERIRWLYTAITRAKKHVAIAKPPAREARAWVG